MTELTQKRLRELLHYDPLTGEFRWRIKTAQHVKVGTIAGSVQSTGYRQIRVKVDGAVGNGRLYCASRLAWLYTHSHWPKAELDHIDGNKSNDQLANLREATRLQNMGNIKRANNNTSGFKGVFWRNDSRRWRATCSANGKRRSLGSFDTAEEAYAAYCSAAIELHGEYARLR